LVQTLPEANGLGRTINGLARAELATPRRRPPLERPALKTAVVLGWMYGSLGLLVLGRLTPGGAVLAAVSLGLAMACCLLTVGHEAMHHPLLRSRSADRAMVAVLVAPMGISPAWWRAKHNITHHGGPARGGRVGEGPVELGPVARLAPDQYWYPWHRLQHLYVPLVLFPLHKFGMIAGAAAFCVTGQASGHQVAPRTVPAAAARLAGWGLPLTVVLGVAAVRHGAVPTLVTTLLVIAASGTALSLVLAVEVAHRGLAQVQPEPGLDPWTRWHVDVSMSIDAPRWVAWFTGGLHQHTEHHLFPRAPMHRLADLAPLVQEACAAEGVTYHRYRSYPASWRAFHAFLVDLGRRPAPPPSAVVGSIARQVAHPVSSER
jgi:linoleoyl-CoA desaturase